MKAGDGFFFPPLFSLPPDHTYKSLKIMINLITPQVALTLLSCSSTLSISFTLFSSLLTSLDRGPNKPGSKETRATRSEPYPPYGRPFPFSPARPLDSYRRTPR